MAGIDAEDAAGAFELRIEIRVEHSLLATEPLDHLGLLQGFDVLLRDGFPVRLTGPAGGRKRFRVLVFADPDFVDVFAESDIGGPFTHPDAACDKKYRHYALP